jgi:predicted MPP superfamily phosphohydrolase
MAFRKSLDRDHGRTLGTPNPIRLELRRRTIHVRDLPADLEGLRVALLSDFHAGRLTPLSVLRRAADEAMRAQPHVIALTGDFVDRSPADLSRAMDATRSLWAPLGVYAVPGNHDHAAGAIDQWHQAVADHETLEDLTNRFVLVHRGEATLCIAGIDDLEEGTPRLELPPPAQRDFTILLAHNPDQAERSRRADDDVDLVLSGHTHGGQVRLPSVGPLHRKSGIYDQGLRRRPWTQVYTSRGLGTTLLPIRLGARPEVAILELTGAPRQVW